MNSSISQSLRSYCPNMSIKRLTQPEYMTLLFHIIVGYDFAVMPRIGFGVTGIFAAEPIADTISAAVCFITFLLTSYRGLRKKEQAQLAAKNEETI